MVERVFGVPHHVARVVMATVSVAACLSVVVGAAPATEPSAASAPAPGEDSGCLRPLLAVISGFLVTLIACALPIWGSEKHGREGEERVTFLFKAVFAPVFGLYFFIERAFESAVLMWGFNKLCPNSSHPKTLWSWLSPFSKSAGRILYGCYIVVYVKKESRLLQEEWLWKDTLVVDESEAMVIGAVAEGKTQNDHYERKELSLAGTTALLLAEVVPKHDQAEVVPKHEKVVPKHEEVVPKHDQLKFLRGKSGFAMIALNCLIETISMIFREFNRSKIGIIIIWFYILLTIVAYAWAFVVTIVYWNSQYFNARGELVNVSQLIPFIG